MYDDPVLPWRLCRAAIPRLEEEMQDQMEDLGSHVLHLKEHQLKGLVVEFLPFLLLLSILLQSHHHNQFQLLLQHFFRSFDVPRMISFLTGYVLVLCC